MRFNIQSAVFENSSGEGDGYCLIIINDNTEGKWIEIHGNQEKAEYPLCFNSKEEVDIFADKLKSFL